MSLKRIYSAFTRRSFLAALAAPVFLGLDLATGADRTVFSLRTEQRLYVFDHMSDSLVYLMGTIRNLSREQIVTGIDWSRVRVLTEKEKSHFTKP